MRPGDRIAGRFEIDREITSGGMGVVFRGRDRASGEKVAIKLMRRDVGTDVRRFMREASILSALDHPGVVRYVSHGLTPAGDPYLVMRWLEGESLSDTLRRRALSTAQTAAMGERVGAALGCSHAAGIVHRDVKPSNIILSKGSPAAAVLIDFGIAAGGGSRLTATGVIFGTPSYMPPEQIRGQRELQPQSDVFSLGAVLYECLAGRPAFPGENYRAIQVKVMMAEPPPLPLEVPPPLVSVVRRMLAKDPAARPADGEAVARALGALDSLDDRTVLSPSLPSEQPTSQIAATSACLLIDGADDDGLVTAMQRAVELEPLGDGGAVARFDDTQAAERVAVELSRALPDATVALAVDADIGLAAERAAGALASVARTGGADVRDDGRTERQIVVFVDGVARSPDDPE